MSLAILLPLTLAVNTVQAQQSSNWNAAPRIDGFDVEPVSQAIAGYELFFTLYGSPGGTASVRLGGATADLAMVEVEPGVYEGTYTIKRRDQINADSGATANLRLGNRVATAILDESLIAGVERPATRAVVAAVAVIPVISRFEVDPPGQLVAGGDMFISISGNPGGVASAKIPGVNGKLMLDEASPGVYEGLYTIKNRDRIANNAVPTATLRLGDKETTVLLGYPLMSRVGSRPNARRAAQACPNCGVVEAVNVIEVQGNGNYIGPILGGIAGAVLGSQVGSGRGTTVAQIAGAVGGAMVGREIQKKTSASKHYEVVVRLENGGTQTIPYDNDPGLAVGTRIRVENGTLIRA